jgi:hypothetical protein
LSFSLSDGVNSTGNDVGNTVVTDSAWHHGTVVVRRTAGTAQFYLDGVSDGSANISSVTGSIDATEVATIGAQRGLLNSFGGSLDDVRIYNRALSGDEIKRLYNMGR